MSTKPSGAPEQDLITSPLTRAQEIEEIGQATDQGFSNSMLSPLGIVTFLLILGLFCFGVGVAPYLISPEGRSWGPTCYSCCLSTVTGSVFDSDQSGDS